MNNASIPKTTEGAGASSTPKTGAQSGGDSTSNAPLAGADGSADPDLGTVSGSTESVHDPVDRDAVLPVREREVPIQQPKDTADRAEGEPDRSRGVAPTLRGMSWCECENPEPVTTPGIGTWCARCGCNMSPDVADVDSAPAHESISRHVATIEKRKDAVAQALLRRYEKLEGTGTLYDEERIRLERHLVSLCGIHSSEIEEFGDIRRNVKTEAE